MNLSFAGSVLLCIIVGGIGSYFLFFAKRHRDRLIERLRRPSTLYVYRGIGATMVLIAIAGCWSFAASDAWHQAVLEAAWFAVFMTVGLFGLFRARWYRDWELRRLEARSKVPALRIIGGFFLVVAGVGLWQLIHTGTSIWP